MVNTDQQRHRKKPQAIKRPDPQSRRIGYAVMGVALALIFVLAGMMAVRSGHAPGLVQGIGLQARLQGSWLSTFNGYRAIFQTQDGTYQILLMTDRSGDPVYYSRGEVAFEGNMMTLTPDPGMGAPQDDTGAIRYTSLTSGTYTVEVDRDGDDFIWRSGPADPERPYNNPAHPLLQYSAQDHILWSLKR